MALRILTIFILYIITLASFVGWVFLSKQENASRSRKTVFHIVFRLGLIFVILFFICLPANIFSLKIIFFFFLLAPVIAFGFFGLVLGSFEFSLLILLCIAEWIIGFPSRKKFFCKPNKHLEDSESDRSLLGCEAFTVTPLRPCGKIIINDKEHDGQSDFGFIEKNQKVVVTGKKGFAFIVRKV